ncbi:MAG: DNA gyrase inhibitor YacG [Planctomycetes bacterium]|nr:DNA gyrase inhibitor YacG [Planctomycetota bacterium]
MPTSWSCPTCGKALSAEPAEVGETFPFCSSRCRLRDFGRWADGRYVVAGPTVDIAESAASGADDA